MKKLLFILIALFYSCSTDEVVNQTPIECCNKITQVYRFDIGTHLIFYITMWNSCINLQTYREISTTNQNFNPQVGDCVNN